MKIRESSLYSKVVLLLAVIGFASMLVSACGSSENDSSNGNDTSNQKDLFAYQEPDEWVVSVDKDPKYIHLTWQHSPATTITVQWTTELTDTNAYEPLVWFASEDEVKKIDGHIMLPASSEFVVVGSGELFQETFATKRGDDYVEWTVELTGLKPNTLYYFRAGTWGSFDMKAGIISTPNLSDLHTFTTAPNKSASSSFKFVSAGDSRGGYDDISANIGTIVEKGGSFWVFNGDMTNMGTMREWYQWFGAMAPFMEGHVLMPVPGNHEVFEPVYYGQFALPREEDLPEDLQEFAWSFDYGNAHFIGLNSNSEDLVVAQKEWLQNDLAAANEDPDIVWKFVMFHQPAYSSGHHGSTDYVQQHWVPIFEQYGVDMVFNGHDHDYERSKPIKDGQVAEDGNGVIYVVIGAFFAPGYSVGSDWWTAVSHDGDGGNWAIVDIQGKQLTFTAYSGDGSQVIDEFTLTKQ